MKREEYSQWLMEEKSYTRKVAGDMVSRASRVCRILEVSDIDDTTIKKLEESEEFKSLSTGVRSQLRKACTTYNNFKQAK